MEMNISGSFESAINCPGVSMKCQMLKSIIENGSNRNLNLVFSRLVEDIFGFNKNTNGWMLSSLTPQVRSLDFTEIKNFLIPNGPMFSIMNKLQYDPSQPRFDFVIKSVPHTVQQSFHNSTSSPMQQRNNTTTVSLSAYEFFFSHFAQYITKPQQQTTQGHRMHLNISSVYYRSNVPTSTNEASLYFVLLDEYLHYFFPLDGSQPPLMLGPHSKSLSNSSQQYFGNADLIIKAPTFRSGNQFLNQNIEVLCSEIILQILSEFWMDGSKIQIITNLKMPFENQVRSIRQLIKHLHYFVNCHSNTTLSDSQEISFAVLQLTQLITGNFYRNIYSFLINCFDAWPLDASFRIVLETWLSFIQPWRYVHANSQKGHEIRLSEDKEIANIWYDFIYSNNYFYTKLFHKVINRFLRMDLSSSKNTILLLRVAKIFGQPNLLDFVEEASDAYLALEQTGRFAHQPGSYMYTSGNDMRQNVSTFKDSKDGFFSEDSLSMIDQLLKVCTQAIVTTKQYRIKQKDSASWTTSVIKAIGMGPLLDTNASLLSGNDSNSSDFIKAEQQLQQSINIFATLFELSIPDVEKAMADNVKSKKKLSDNLPDHMNTKNGDFQLTDIGRYQVVTQEKHGPIIPKVHPDLMPITSSENATLVRLLYKLSLKVNTKNVNRFLTKECSRNDVLGRFCRHMFVPRHQYESPVKQTFEPRISFRFWAHYRTLFYLGLWLVITSILSLSFSQTVFYGIFLLLVYVFIDYITT